jgi:hypothetical protein
MASLHATIAVKVRQLLGILVGFYNEERMSSDLTRHSNGVLRRLRAKVTSSFRLVRARGD